MHKPSETNRAKVIALVTNGARQDRIAEHLAIDAKTLRKHYPQRLGGPLAVSVAEVDEDGWHQRPFDGPDGLVRRRGGAEIPAGHGRSLRYRAHHPRR